MRIIILVCITLTLAAQEQAFEPIGGAFGIDLGQQFDPTQATAQGELTNGTPMYGFKPTKPYQAFQDYWVLITPRTQQVYAIWARGKFDNAAKASAEADVLMTILTRKYGPQDKDSMAIGDVRVIQQANRSVVVKVDNNFSSAALEARYYAIDLEQLAKEERLQIEAAERDTGGL